MEISSTHGQRQSSWLRLCRLPEDGGNAGADGKTCDDRFLQPGREVAEGKFGIRNRISPTPRISEQELLDCVFNHGCAGGGACAWALDWGIEHGFIRAADYPYEGEKSASCLHQDNRKRIMKVAEDTFFRHPTAFTIA